MSSLAHNFTCKCCCNKRYGEPWYWKGNYYCDRCWFQIMKTRSKKEEQEESDD